MLPVSDQYPVLPIEHPVPQGWDKIEGEPSDKSLASVASLAAECENDDVLNIVEVRERCKFCDRVRDCIEGVCVACDRDICGLMDDTDLAA